MLRLWSGMPWWLKYASSVPPAPQQSYFTVLCAKRDTVVMETRPQTIPYPQSRMGKGPH